MAIKMEGLEFGRRVKYFQANLRALQRRMRPMWQRFDFSQSWGAEGSTKPNIISCLVRTKTSQTTPGHRGRTQESCPEEPLGFRGSL